MIAFCVCFLTEFERKAEEHNETVLSAAVMAHRREEASAREEGEKGKPQSGEGSSKCLIRCSVVL